MFSSSDKNKKDAFVSRSKAAREQRNLEKHQEKAAIKIQVKLTCQVTLDSSIRLCICYVSCL